MSNWDPAGSNPYNAPESGFADQASAGEGQISIRTIETMRQTRPWAMFVGVVSMIFGVLSLGLAVVIGYLFMNRNVDQAELTVAAGVYVVSGITQLILGTFAIRFAAKTGAFVAMRDAEHLDQALAANRSFWSAIGIIAAVMVGLILLGFLMGVMASVANVGQ